MSPKAGFVLQDQVVPRLRSAIPTAVHCVGAEDHHELIQDATAMAAKMMNNVEQAGKKVTPGNIAYYTLQHVKSGRRSVGYSNADVMGSATQLNGRSKVWSLEHPIPDGDSMDQDFVFAELFEADHEDPSTLTARKMDWESFMATQNDRCQAIIVCLAEGGTLKSVARRFGLSCATILYHKERLTQAIRDFMGTDILALVVKQPEWKSNLRAMREKHARTN